MACNYKISSVTIAVLTIVFGSLFLTKTCYDMQEYADVGPKVRSHQIASVICNLISIVAGLLIYGVVSDNVVQNQRRRHMLLPYIVWHLLVVVLLIALCIYTAIIHRHDFGIVAKPVFSTGCLICILFLCVVMVRRYHASLASSSAFTYAQMDDVNEAKKPLA